MEKPGEYRFWTRSDDGSRLLVNGVTVVENGGIHAAQDREGRVTLAAGAHALEVIYFEAAGDEELQVQWQPPGGRREAIPATALSHEGQPMVPVGAGDFSVDPRKAAAGASHYLAMQCVKCHGEQPSTHELSVLVPGAPALAQLRARQPGGCIAPTKSAPNAPRFALTDRQRVVLLATLQNQGELELPLEPHEAVRRTMTTLNCHACHGRDRRGGAEGLRRDYMASTGEVDLGDEGRIPPTLTGAGAKLQRDWLRRVLVEGAAVRPYMATRMPQFGAANVGHLPELLAQADARAEAAPAPDVKAPGQAELAHKAGRRLLGTTGLSCIACHGLAGRKSLGIPALDLATTGERLQWDWFRRYLLDPQSLRPGTRMPAFWQEGRSAVTGVLEGGAEAQIAALWAYLARRDFTDLPAGLVQARQELVATTEPVIYRHFIDGGGPRAIGVGYPERANLAFNAAEQRLALIWQGSFIDAARHRTGRGQGFEKPLGTSVVALPGGAPWAVLESESTPWPRAVGKEAGYRFGGYRLDAAGRPIFRYAFAAVSVEDFPEPEGRDDEVRLRRTLTLRSTQPVERLYFRAAVAPRIERTGEVFAIGERVKMSFPGAEAIVRSSEGQTELLVPVRWQDGVATLVQLIVW